jgi:hypothetical protein
MAYPVEPKAQAGAAAAAAAGGILYLLQHYVFKGTVPDGVQSMVYLVAPGVVAFVAAYLAPHQSRTPPAPVPVPPPAALTSASSFTPEQMEAVRDVLEHEQGAADERKVPPAP